MPTSHAPDPGSLIEASSFLIERGFCGLVWLDADLIVRQRAGSLVDFVSLDVPVGEAIVALYGCDSDVQALRHGTRCRFELANVRIVGPNDDGQRLNFYLHWLATSGRFLLIAIGATSQSELEAELENQSRRRALAEAETVEQAKALRVLNTELMRVNDELSEFANIISHDLKSPMRELRYQTEDIENALAGNDLPSALARLEDVKRQSRRMSRMLTDLLTYARIGRKEDAITETDTLALTTAIVASLPRPTGMRVVIAGEWPKMETVAAALDLVLRNLLDNAIKHHDRPVGRVEVEAKPAQQGLQIEVRDDGPGIAPRHHAAAFQPFRKITLEQAAETSGTGIGLSLVRKAAETIGASLTLQSDPALRRGTTFRLVWPGRIKA